MEDTAEGRGVFSLIREAVLEEANRLGVRVEKIILFGSRARGDYREDSDYDILIVIEDAGREVRRELWRRLHRRLVKLLAAPVDIVLVSAHYWREYRGVPGTILYLAEREGVVVA